MVRHTRMTLPVTLNVFIRTSVAFVSAESGVHV